MFFCSSATFHSMMALFGDRIFPKSSFYPKKAKFCSVKVGSKQDQRDFRNGWASRWPWMSCIRIITVQFNTWGLLVVRWVKPRNKQVSTTASALNVFCDHQGAYVFYSSRWSDAPFSTEACVRTEQNCWSKNRGPTILKVWFHDSIAYTSPTTHRIKACLVTKLINPETLSVSSLLSNMAGSSGNISLCDDLSNPLTPTLFLPPQIVTQTTLPWFVLACSVAVRFTID